MSGFVVAEYDWKHSSTVILPERPSMSGLMGHCSDVPKTRRDVAIKLWAASGVPMLEICDEPE